MIAAVVASLCAAAAPVSAETLSPSSDPFTITTVAGTGVGGPSGDGASAVQADLELPQGVAEDAAGALYVSDTGNNVVRKIMSPTSIHVDVIEGFAGTGHPGFRGDFGPAVDAWLNQPHQVAADSKGDVFIADSANNRIREVLPSGTIVTVAGNGRCGRAEHGGDDAQPRSVAGLPSAVIGLGLTGERNENADVAPGDGGRAVDASLCNPWGVAVDRAGNLYIADTGHHEIRVVRKDGLIDRYAGTGRPGYSGDGRQAGKAALDAPVSLAIDSMDKLYIADALDNVVREVTQDHIIHTVAGNGRSGFSGDGGPATEAKLFLPTGVALDPLGNLFITDTLNQRIRELRSDEKIHTVAGTGVPGFSGDGGAARNAKLNFPLGSLAADGAAVYFPDTVNQRVRGLFTGPPPVLPESSLAVLFPIMVLALGVTAFGVKRLCRRRHQTA
jgi:hypothetical protein